MHGESVKDSANECATGDAEKDEVAVEIDDEEDETGVELKSEDGGVGDECEVSVKA